jgi:hypothetical protein
MIGPTASISEPIFLYTTTIKGQGAVAMVSLLMISAKLDLENMV